MILGLHHAQITIPTGGETAAREFYCSLLKLKEIEKRGSSTCKGGLWLQLGPVQIHVSVQDGLDRRASKSHLAYLVDELEPWKCKLAEKGFKPGDAEPIPGYTRFFVRDPFGNRLEFLRRN